MQQASDVSSADDEAPEEVALSVGKSQAATRRKQERASEAEHRQNKTSRHRNRRASDTEAQLGSTSQAPVSEAEAEQAEQDALPEDVIEALTSLHAAASRTQVSAELPQLPATQVKQRKRQRILQRKAGPVTVRVLDSGLSGQPSESAVHFAQTQLHANKRRSVEMLRPCHNWSGKHSKTIRSCSGPALQFVKRKQIA